MLGAYLQGVGKPSCFTNSNISDAVQDKSDPRQSPVLDHVGIDVLWRKHTDICVGEKTYARRYKLNHDGDKVPVETE